MNDALLDLLFWVAALAAMFFGFRWLQRRKSAATPEPQAVPAPERHYDVREVAGQFWAGQFRDADSFYEFVAEDGAVSAFAASQGAAELDDDLLELGFFGPGSDRVNPFEDPDSHAWTDEFSRLASEAGLSAPNCYIRLKDGPDAPQIATPVSTQIDGQDLVYLGEIAFEEKTPIYA